MNDDQPGWVECRLTDVHARSWTFIKKVPVVTTEYLGAESTYPQPGVIACRVVDKRMGADELEVVIIDTSEPWGVEATTGETRFEVRPEQLEEFERN